MNISESSISKCLFNHLPEFRRQIDETSPLLMARTFLKPTRKILRAELERLGEGRLFNNPLNPLQKVCEILLKELCSLHP